jgi:hypothetical protein
LRLRVITTDARGTSVRVCELEEARTWDYADPARIIAVGGIQIRSWEELLETVSTEAYRGCDEVEVYQMPPLVGG